MAADGIIRYNHEAIAETVQQMLQLNQQINQQMEDLEKQVRANKEQYLGASSEHYEQNAATISQDLNSSTERLQQVSQAVQQGSDDLSDQDNQLANLFQ
ncbi:WXG100 family type VII secretion target [Amycolatopsis pithecellobii]|uniref:ESAT-6-like protein n=1 Tax=Amycolatopsis pithecellobii TaxID=664692 RepID=A0A6N7YQW4_9PSEU|nr:WXG100 family type VII secretion target [Amycolatopsis pithecellobii]MTD55407.1 hypothetical protein [Amycolatopsis pithecellobii]